MPKINWSQSFKITVTIDELMRQYLGEDYKERLQWHSAQLKFRTDVRTIEAIEIWGETKPRRSGGK